MSVSWNGRGSCLFWEKSLGALDIEGNENQKSWTIVFGVFVHIRKKKKDDFQHKILKVFYKFGSSYGKSMDLMVKSTTLINTSR